MPEYPCFEGNISSQALKHDYGIHNEILCQSGKWSDVNSVIGIAVSVFEKIKRIVDRFQKLLHFRFIQTCSVFYTAANAMCSSKINKDLVCSGDKCVDYDRITLLEEECHRSR